MTAFGLICYWLGAIIMAALVEMLAKDAHSLTKAALILSWPLIMAWLLVEGVIRDIRRSGRGW